MAHRDFPYKVKIIFRCRSLAYWVFSAPLQLLLLWVLLGDVYDQCLQSSYSSLATASFYAYWIGGWMSNLIISNKNTGKLCYKVSFSFSSV